jgi:fucose 4-O-acetylase-like acetyltransferase
LILLPLLLKLWIRLNLVGKFALTYGTALTSFLLREHFDFFGIWQLKAIIVEVPGAFCFGVLSRGSMAMAGMLLGEIVIHPNASERGADYLAYVLYALGAAALGVFFFQNQDSLPIVLNALAHNAGKHPPSFTFLTFSLGGAAIILAYCLRLSAFERALSAPFKILGSESLWCFNLHLLIIFIGYRYLLGLRHNVTYGQALMLTAINIMILVSTCLIRRAWKKARKSHDRAPRPNRRLARDADAI